MQDQDIVQNMISQLGQSQDARTPAALDIYFAAVDERTDQDFLAYAKNFADLIYYYRDNISANKGTWAGLFASPSNKKALAAWPATVDGNMPPHLGLLLAFFGLYQQPQQLLNGITGRHLDFYYKDVLQLVKNPAVPDRVHIALELKKQALPTAISPSNTFSGGKDATGVELIYAPTRKTVINTSAVDSLRSIYVDGANGGVVHYAPIANSSDGLGGQLSPPEMKWPGFGVHYLPPAEVGFAVASPVLRMAEGKRSLTLILKLSNFDSSKLNSAALKGAFNAYLTGEKNWVLLNPTSVDLGADGKLQMGFAVPDGEKGIIDYSAAIHGYTYMAQAPVLQLILDPANAQVGYNDLKGAILQTAQVSVSVEGAVSLDVESDSGTLNPKRAFQPFGPQPVVHSRFFIGYDEALAKNLTGLDINITWQGAPSDFQSYYSTYANSPVTDNNYFTATASFDYGSGSVGKISAIPLFNSTDATLQTQLTLIPGVGSPLPSWGFYAERMRAFVYSGTDWGMAEAEKLVLEQPVFKPFMTAPPQPRGGFVTLSLDNDFLQSAYRQQYVSNVLTYTKSGSGTPTILNEPYTPVIQSISLDYSAQTAEVSVSSTKVEDYSNPDIQFFHTAYFGQMREHGYQRSRFAFLTDDNVTLLPTYDNEGELLIGFTGLNPNDSVSVLFQVAEGSADPSLARENITWFALCDNYWKPLGTEQVALDTTDQLLTSGIVQFVIPPEATRLNSILPTDHIWIKGCIQKDVNAVCQLIDVKANAVEAQFTDNGNDPNHLETPLPDATITKLKAGIASVKTVSQPYASFGGSPVETDVAFYTRVSERLRHKDRCISPWDYERSILEAFPNVHMVKCIPHSSLASWLAPGHVMIVLVPDLRNQNAVHPLQPKVSAEILKQVTEWAQNRAWAQSSDGTQTFIHVKNPCYQTVQLDFKVSFAKGYEFNYYSRQLNQQLIEFLSPWAFDSGSDISFGGTIYKSVLLDFIKKISYVDFVVDFKMHSFVGGTSSSADLEEVQAAWPDTILVSADQHQINQYDPLSP